MKTIDPLFSLPTAQVRLKTETLGHYAVIILPLDYSEIFNIFRIRGFVQMA